MAEFSVDLAALHGMRAQLGRLATDIGAIRVQLGKIDPGAFSGALVSVRPRFEDVLRAQVNSAVNAQLDAQSVSDALGDIRDYYGTTDRAQVARFDATLPGTPVENWGAVPEATDVPAGPYRDVNDPLGRLTEPPSHDEMTWDPSITSDLRSIPQVVREVIKVVMGEDPLEKLEELLVGDWREIRRMADRFNSIGWAFRDCADNIENCQSTSLNDWTGNAADAARGYLVLLARGCSGEFQRNGWLSDQLTEFAEGAMGMVDSLVAIALDWINNKLFAAIASAGIAGGAEEMPGVDVVMDIYAGSKVYEAVEAGFRVYDEVNAIRNKIDEFANALRIVNNGSLAPPGLDAPPMPTAAYQSPL